MLISFITIRLHLKKHLLLCHLHVFFSWFTFWSTKLINVGTALAPAVVIVGWFLFIFWSILVWIVPFVYSWVFVSLFAKFSVFQIAQWIIQWFVEWPNIFISGKNICHVTMLVYVYLSGFETVDFIYISSPNNSFLTANENWRRLIENKAI